MLFANEMEPVVWSIQYCAPPPVFRHCKKCGKRSEYICSGEFRVNAQQKTLDIWLIYKCIHCNTTWNSCKFEFEAARKIRMNCQCGYGMEEKLALVKELMADATSIEEFTNSEKAKDAGLFCRDGALFLQFGFCPCPMLAEVEKLETNTWCQCTTGYSKVLFEKAFSCSADVVLLQSIKMGDPVCLMKITLHHPVWR